MDRWELKPAPSADDPDRHVLRIHGGPADVAALLRTFGARLGRPSPLKGRDFNLSFVVHTLAPGRREKLEAWLTAAAPPPPPPSSAPPLDPVLPSWPAQAPPFSPPPAPVSAAASADAAAQGVLAPPPVPFAAELRPDWTFDTLLVGAYNRFAHAAAMSVVSSPGTMYNPLFLYGVPGTGKSHLLHAIGAALSKGLGAAVLLSTSGSRLSGAADVAAGKGAVALDARIEGARALLVDDIHLMAVTDVNKELLARIFQSFFDRQQQVVITSLYPPRALGALEEALKFSFSKGWSVDLKLPSPLVQKDLIAACAERAGGALSAEDVSLLHEKLSQWGYQELSLWMSRALALQRIRATAGAAATMKDLLALIYDPLLAGAQPPGLFTSNFRPPDAPPDAPALAVLAPGGQEGLGPFAAATLYEVGAQHGFRTAFRHVLWETYDSEQSLGVPFLVGETCRKAGVGHALVVGPLTDSALGPRAAEFAHASRRILEGLGVRMGWVPYSGLALGAHYLNAWLDLQAARP